MQGIFNFLIRLVLIVAGLVFAASLALVALLLLVLWAVRALWCKLTGQPVNPFVVRMDPRNGFSRVYRPARPDSAQDMAPARVQRMGMDDVTDVEPKP